LLVGTFIYLFVEIKNGVEGVKIGKKAEKDKLHLIILRRTVTILIMGLTEASIMGLIMCALLSRYLSPENLSDNIKMIAGIKLPLVGELFGNMYPHGLFLFASLALFIGIFVQIIWEDKPITHPL
jgi:hypothetical protein